MRKTTRYLGFCSLFSFALLLASCEKVRVSSVSLNENTLTLEVGELTTLKANILPTNASNKTIAWESSDSSVATVDDNGLIVPKTRGTALISATSQDGGKRDTCFLTVTNLSISSFSPAEARHGETLSIQGENFSAAPLENSVTLNGVVAEVISATPNEIKVKVPKNMRCTGLVRVSVASKTASSSSPFTYLPTTTVSTFAGSPQIQGFADGLAENAKFNFPAGIAIDVFGTICMTDFWNHRVRCFSLEPWKLWAVGTIAGTGDSGANNGGFADGYGITPDDGATLARFNGPSGIVADKAGIFWVADAYNHRIRKVFALGENETDVSTLAGGGGIGEGKGDFADGEGEEARFSEPADIAIGKDGNFYVADATNHRIRKVTPQGEVSTFAGSGPVGEDNGGFTDGPGNTARFNEPSGIAIDKDGNLYVADTNNHRIRKVTPQGEVSTLAGSGLIGEDNGGFADGPGNTARFHWPVGIAIGEEGNLYVADFLNHRIRKVTPQGEVSTFAGSRGEPGFADGPEGVAKLFGPFGIALDSAGDLYVTEVGNHLIRKISLEKMEN